MTGKVLFTIILGLALISCDQDAEPSYNGLSLPTPQPIRGFPEQPPAAWLIIDGKAIRRQLAVSVSEVRVQIWYHHSCEMTS